MKIRYTNFDGLLNAGVSDFLLQDNELVACKNVWVYKIGKIEKVPGYEKANSNAVVASQTIRHLHYYYDTSNSINYLLAVCNSSTSLTLKYRTTGDWTTITGISTSWDTYAGSQLSMENFLGKTFIVGYKTGSTFLPSATITATTFSTTDSNITDMPQGKFIVRYRDLLYVLYAKTGGTVYPSRVYYSDEPTAGAITWTIATNFIEFGYDDGDEITAGTEALDRLIVFKHYSMWKYDESSRSKIADIGCDSYKSIQKINGVLYWSNRKGVYRWAGSYPQLISAKAQPFFDAIDQTTLGNQVADIYDEVEYRLFIGTVTVEGITYTNAWFCWDTMKEKCYIRCTIHSATSACNYVEAGKRRSYFGSSNGYVYKFANKIDNVYADDGNQIDSFFITKALDHGQPENKKFTNNITFFTKYGIGMKVAVEKDNSSVFNEDNASVLSSNIYNCDIEASAHRFRYKFYEKGLGKSFQFEGFVINTDLLEEAQ